MNKVRVPAQPMEQGAILGVAHGPMAGQLIVKGKTQRKPRSWLRLRDLKRDDEISFASSKKRKVISI